MPLLRHFVIKKKGMLNMKAFVYDKRTNETLAVFEKVREVKNDRRTNIVFITSDVGMHEFDTKKVKTRIYQN